MKDVFISLNSLKKAYGNETVFHSINLDINEGEIISLVGPSGAGKSTLLQCIAGIEELDEGNIWIEGEDMSPKPAHRRPIVMMFQQPLLFPHMTVMENIVYGLTFTTMTKKERIEKATLYLKRMDMENFRDFYPSKLSGGQQQRVSLARALITDPKLLLLDEPLSSLDNELREETRLWMKQWLKEKKITTIFVTHDKEEAMLMGDRVVVIGNQTIQQCGNPIQVYDAPSNSFVANFFSDGIVIDNRFFIHAKHIEICNDLHGAWYMKWKGIVQEMYIKYGKFFYQITISDWQTDVIIQSDTHFSKMQCIWVGIRSKEYIQTFKKDGEAC
ncbi:Sulfate/thiosulfate import ATP-binding protein CysA [Anoxybacillus thermarum]|uniref:Carnitine transport ATP-binding protein OpuCA n=1 Tax=Anoxybacillus thermarum TaxID=404937 RepID=A0A0D0QXY1_9BACL|nr:ABC transporter ATP-binding protein [Anoxybacillus thermarum]KIQ94284.1 Sulfate/thiosulfate import ATP-binding protein CysA [Anoxybacillus thermarum]